MKITSPVLFILGSALVTVAYISVGAQQPASVLGGVYTDAQAKRGEKVYGDNCVPCHGPKLQGTDTAGPTLTGPDFVNGWKDMTVAALLAKISSDMPSNAPGSLKPEEYADVLSFVLSSNKYPAGQTELPTDPVALKSVKMAAAPK
jgi:polar amino acid transport system substrate-binding protein